jgi:hypothetical protein
VEELLKERLTEYTALRMGFCSSKGIFVAIHYLLPCRCGRKKPVVQRQAGQTIVCDCGVSLEIPTLLELTALEQCAAEPAEPIRSRAKHGWGIRQRFALAGFTSVLLSAGLAIYLALNPPIRPLVHPELTHQKIEALTAVQARLTWRQLRAEGISPNMRQDAAFATARSRYQLWIVADAVLGVLGVALCVAMFIPRSKP